MFLKAAFCKSAQSYITANQSKGEQLMELSWKCILLHQSTLKKFGKDHFPTSPVCFLRLPRSCLTFLGLDGLHLNHSSSFLSANHKLCYTCWGFSAEWKFDAFVSSYKWHEDGKPSGSAETRTCCEVATLSSVS